MNPFECLSSDIFPNIFQHFVVREILNASLVSPSWNKTISESFSCMEKIWLRFYDPLDDVESLMKSNRKYRNFKVQRKLNPKIENVFKKFEWKGVMMRDMAVFERKINEYQDFMNHLAPSVQEIEWWCVTKKERLQKLLPPIDFPMLRKLECCFCSQSVDMFSVFLGKNPRLNHLKLSTKYTFSYDSNLPSILVQFLKQNNQIKHLTPLNFMFQNDISAETNLDLESIVFSLNFEVVEKENFIKFIQSQPNIASFSFERNSPDVETFSEIFNAMRCCKTIVIEQMCNRSPLNVKIQPSITKLKIVNTFFYLEQFLMATPNLESLYALTLTKEALEFASRNLKSLKLIKCFSKNKNHEEWIRDRPDNFTNITLQRLSAAEFRRDVENWQVSRQLLINKSCSTIIRICFTLEHTFSPKGNVFRAIERLNSLSNIIHTFGIEQNSNKKKLCLAFCEKKKKLVSIISSQLTSSIKVFG